MYTVSCVRKGRSLRYRVPRVIQTSSNAHAHVVSFGPLRFWFELGAYSADSAFLSAFEKVAPLDGHDPKQGNACSVNQYKQHCKKKILRKSLKATFEILQVPRPPSAVTLR